MAIDDPNKTLETLCACIRIGCLALSEPKLHRFTVCDAECVPLSFQGHATAINFANP